MSVCHIVAFHLSLVTIVRGNWCSRISMDASFYIHENLRISHGFVDRFEMLRVSIRLDRPVILDGSSSYNEIKSEMQESGHITEISCHDYFMQNRIQTHQNQSQRQSMKSLLLSKPAPRLWPRLLRRKPGNQPDGLLLYT